MKIWVVGRGYPTPANKMWGSFELEQAKLLARNGHEVSYISLTLSFFKRKDRRGLQTFIEDNVKIFTYSHFYFPGNLGVYWESYEDDCWKKLFREAEKNGIPDVIHIHYPSMISSINVVEEYRNLGVKIFATEHWSRVLINNLKSHEVSRLQYYTSKASCFASVSKPLEIAVKERVNVTVPTEIIPNIVSPMFFDTYCKERSDVFTFISVGRLVPIKQFDIIIKQFCRVFEGNAFVRLKIIGSGKERNKLVSLCNGDKRIKLLGEVSLKRVAEEMMTSDALISFSKYETFAVPVAEAWACGKPVIASDSSGVASFINSSNGIVVKAETSEKLGEAMRSLHDYYNNYDPTHISSYARENFSDQAIIGKLENMYSEY